MMLLKKLVCAGLLCLSGCTIQDPAEPGRLVPKTVDEDPSLPALTLRTTKLHVERFGDPARPLLIMLHGGPGDDSRYMLPLAGRYQGYSLQDEYSLLFYDQRGSGLSRRHTSAADYSNDILGQELAEVIEQVAPTRSVVLVGQSWGGQLAVLYANQHPEKVAGLVLLEPGEFTGQIARDFGRPITSLDLNLYQSITWSRAFFTEKDQQRADYYVAMADLETQDRYHSPFWRPGYFVKKLLAVDEYGRYNWDYTTNLSQYKTKVLFINGDQSPISDAFQREHQVRFFARYQDYKFPDCEHDEMLFNPAYQGQVVALIKNYLREVL